MGTRREPVELNGVSTPAPPRQIDEPAERAECPHDFAGARCWRRSREHQASAVTAARPKACAGQHQREAVIRQD